MPRQKEVHCLDPLPLAELPFVVYLLHVFSLVEAQPRVIGDCGGGHLFGLDFFLKVIQSCRHLTVGCPHQHDRVLRVRVTSETTLRRYRC
jgi:hypothetical protein